MYVYVCEIEKKREEEEQEEQEEERRTTTTTRTTTRTYTFLIVGRFYHSDFNAIPFPRQVTMSFCLLFRERENKWKEIKKNERERERETLFTEAISSIASVRGFISFPPPTANMPGSQQMK